MSCFSENLRKLRHKSGKTQKDVADYLKITDRGYRGYELGTREPDVEKINSLANYFDVPVDYLLGNGIYGQLQSVPKLKEVLATEIEKQLGDDLFQSLLGGPLSAVDDVTFGKIADLLVKEIQICEDGSIVIQFKG